MFCGIFGGKGENTGKGMKGRVVKNPGIRFERGRSVGIKVRRGWTEVMGGGKLKGMKRMGVRRKILCGIVGVLGRG